MPRKEFIFSRFLPLDLGTKRLQRNELLPKKFSGILLQSKVTIFELTDTKQLLLIAYI